MATSPPLPIGPKAKKTMCAVEAPLDSITPLSPLLRRLAENRAATSVERFPRGTLLPNGRLDLCKQGIGPAYADAVAEALQADEHVRALLLGADHLGPAGVRAIASGEGERRRLSALYLGCNAMGGSGSEALATQLEGHPVLRGLWIKRNEIGGEGARTVAALVRTLPQIRTLDLACNGIDHAGLEVVVEAVLARGIEALFLCGNDLGPRGGEILARLLGGPSRLRVLVASANDLGDEGAGAIARALERNVTLATLGLGSNAIGEAGARALARAVAIHPSLLRLELGRAAATEVLGATPNRIGDEGASHLAAALNENPRLEALDVGGSGIGDDGARRLALAAIRGSRRLVSLDLGCPAPDDVRSELLATLCARKNQARNPEPDDGFRDDVALVKSVYRTSRARADSGEEPVPPPFSPPLPPPVISPDEIAGAARVALAIARGEVSVPAEMRGAFLDAGRRLARAHPHRVKDRKRIHRLLVEDTGIRRLRRDEGVGDNVTNGATALRAPVLLDRPRRCYICKSPYRALDWFYDQLCPRCAETSHAKRAQTADLRGRIALVTGARTKIGHETALKLLRAGATVVGTSRFPFDAAARFGRASDFDDFAPRLFLYGLDLRFLPSVERFAAQVEERFGWLDILVHNAAQTIARTPEFYREWSSREALAKAALAAPMRDRVAGLGGGAPFEAPVLPAAAENDALSLVMGREPVDARATNSWRLCLGEIPTGEILSAHLVSALAPFVLTQALLPAIRRRPQGDGFVVSASAVEGQFGRPYKTPFHPHTNMAKAALNMMTRTSAENLAGERIFATAVDTGWITNENPRAISAAMEIRGFEPPLDAIEGASRLCDPVFSAVNGAVPAFGVFLKDYRATAW
jgi:NAD(P)-dependent dehydrogenase (short-subunit alcohol dehydrogenase family)/Ran GTPase-activating protein (RanGAP) involved in mRNA processing and transport